MNKSGRYIAITALVISALAISGCKSNKSRVGVGISKSPGEKAHLNVSVGRSVGKHGHIGVSRTLNK